MKTTTKVLLKDVNKVTLTEAKSSVGSLTDSQLNNLIEKLSKLYKIVCLESDARFAEKLSEEMEEEEEIMDEVNLMIEDNEALKTNEETGDGAKMVG